MTRLEYNAVIEELARLATFDVTLKDVIDYYIARHRASDARKYPFWRLSTVRRCKTPLLTTGPV